MKDKNQCKCKFPILVKVGIGCGDKPVKWDNYLTCQVCAKSKLLLKQRKKC